ncbi:MAG: tetratricopeptide repeat protein [Candidatus Margulisiibacteriota bacterium]
MTNNQATTTTLYRGFCLWRVIGIPIIILGMFGDWLLPTLPADAWRISPELQRELKEKQAAVKAHPNDPHAYFDLAITMAYTNNLQEGWNNLKKTVEIDPNFRKKGLDLYIKKVTESPGDWRLRFRLAFAYYFNDKKTEAIRELENVLKIDPYNVWAYGYIALIYGEMNEIDKALEATQKGLKIDSNVAALHLLLAEGYNRKGDKWKAFLESMEAMRLRALGY